MSYSPVLGNPKPYFPDNNGDPYVGMRLFFYATDTSTKQDTQTDSTGLVDNTNPIVIGADGYPTGDVMIYGQNNFGYKVVAALPGSDDPPTSPLWTINKIYPGITIDGEWINPLIATRASVNTFTVTGNYTSLFTIGRRIKATGGEDRYAIVTAAIYSAPNTTVTLTAIYDNTETTATLHVSMDTVYVALNDPSILGNAYNYYEILSIETAANIYNIDYKWNNVLRYIPREYHAGILAGTETTNMTGYFNNAISDHGKIKAPKGTYYVNDINVVGNMEVEGEGGNYGTGTILIVDTVDSGAFTNTSASIIYNVRIANLTIKVASGITGARAYKQTDKSTYSAHFKFENVETWKELEISYDGFFIFTLWEWCRDAFSGTDVGGQTHGCIDSNPAATGQVYTTNLNQVVRCKFFNNTAIAYINISWGYRWNIKDTDFEGGTASAIRTLGIYGLEIDGCWFENLDTSYINVVTVSTGAGVQGSRPCVINNCHVKCHTNNLNFVYVGSASTIGFNHVDFAYVPATMTLTNVTEVDDLQGIKLLSGTYSNFLTGINQVYSSTILRNSEIESTVINSPYTSNINLLPIGPNGLGAASFTNSGYTAVTDVASAIGLPANAVRVTLSGGANFLYYQIPAKLVTFLQGKTITLSFIGYGSAGGTENVIPSFWDSVSPAYTNVAAATYISNGLINTANLTIGAYYYTVGASATSLYIGVRSGGGAPAQTYAIEAMRLLLGEIKSLHPGFN